MFERGKKPYTFLAGPKKREEGGEK